MLSPERAMMVEKVSTPESEVSSPKNQIPPCCRKKEVK
jgi:hypothetical protein